MQPPNILQLHHIVDRGRRAGILREGQALNLHMELDRLEAEGFTGAPEPAPVVKPPAPEPEPRPQRVVKPTRRPITLSESARATIQARLPELLSHPSEVTLWAALNESGEVLTTHATSSGHLDTDTSNHGDSILRMVRTLGVRGVFLMHSHPVGPDGEGGLAHASAKDQKFTQWVEDTLKPWGVPLVDHHVLGCRDGTTRSVRDTTPQKAVPALHEAQEPHRAQPMPSAWDMRNAEEQRLWKPYGGVRPQWAGGR